MATPYGYFHQRGDSKQPLLPEINDLPSPPHSPTYPTLLTRFRNRRLLFIVLAVLSIVSLALLSSVTVLGSSPEAHYVHTDLASPADSNTSRSIPTPTPAVKEPQVLEYEEEDYQYSPALLGPPTTRFRDNLRNDTQYITSWISAGWTNDVMTYANLIYLGTITNRVPIIAMFTPSHIGGHVPPIGFGEVFDVPRFIEESGIEIVEWDEVKDSESTEVEDIGCWNVWEAVQYNEHFPRRSTVPDILGLDISYTKAPNWIKLIPDYPHDLCSTFWSLARLSFPEEREKSLGTTLPSPLHGNVLEPDEHLLCYDYLYYACASQSAEYEHDYSPAWRYVATHLHWTSMIEGLSARYIRRAFKLPYASEIPPYIAVHVRHGDFGQWCWAAETPEDCFASLPVIVRRVREVQDELRVQKGINIPMSRVIITSDEKDPAWWDDVKALGWVGIDHEAMRTEEVYGEWFPVILDAAIQSFATGFVGTDRSTYSVLSRRRVEDWQGGVTRMFKWGSKNADAH